MNAFDRLNGFDGLPERRTAYDVAYTSLREAILTGTLRSGSKLVQSKIAESLGVSNTPVREALRDLAADGLVQLADHRGAIVREIPYEEVDGIYRIRVALTPLLVTKAVERVDSDTVAKLEAILAELSQTADPQGFLRVLTRFDTVLGNQAGWPMLERMLHTLQAMSALHVGAEIGYETEGVAGEFWSSFQESAKSWRRQLLDLVRDSESTNAGRVAGDMMAATLEEIALYHEKMASVL